MRACISSSSTASSWAQSWASPPSGTKWVDCFPSSSSPSSQTLSLLYSVLYEKAFAVPETCDRAKMVMAREITGSRVMERPWKIYAIRCVKGLPSYGISVGSFHTFEKESTPVFILITLSVTLLACWSCNSDIAGVSRTGSTRIRWVIV